MLREGNEEIWYARVLLLRIRQSPPFHFLNSFTQYYSCSFRI